MAKRDVPRRSPPARASWLFLIIGVGVGIATLITLLPATQPPFEEREWTKPWAEPAEVKLWHEEWETRAAPWAKDLPDPPGFGPVERERYWLSRAAYEMEVRRRGDRFVVAVAGVDEQILGGGWAAYGEGRIEGAESGFAGATATFRWSCLSVRFGTASDGVGRITFTADGAGCAAVYVAHEAPELWYKAYGERLQPGVERPERGTIKGQIPYAEALAKLQGAGEHLVNIRVVDTMGTPIPGAVVQLRGHARTRQATNRLGLACIRFRSAQAPIAQTFSAGKEGYFNSETSHLTGDLDYARADSGEEGPEVVIRLQRAELGDNIAYQWQHPSKDADPDDMMACSSCHTWHYHQWIGSRHARMADNGFVALERLTMRAHAPDAPDDCAGCHQPAAAASDPTTTYRARGVLAGNHCDLCHKIERVGDLRQSGALGAFTFGRPDLTKGERPGGIGRVYGTAPDSIYAYMGAIYNPIFASSHLCAGCHQGGGRWRDGLPPKIDTFNEWRRWAIDVAAKKQTPKTCQDCHMAGASIRTIDGEPVRQLAYDAMQREPEDVHGHAFPGRAPEFAAKSIAVEVTKRRDETTAEWVVTVALTNTGAGHKIPTGTWTKHVAVGVWAKAGDAWLASTGGEKALLVAPDGLAEGAGRAAGDWRNPSGTVLGVGTKSQGSVPHVRPAFWAAWPKDDIVDRRLAPGERREVECRFEAEGADAPPAVHIWVVHRRGDIGARSVDAPFPMRPYDAPPEVVWQRIIR